MTARLAICIGCGCDDMHACLGAFDEPCGWLVIERQQFRGVCTSCPTHLARWNRKQRELSVRAANAVKRRDRLATVG